MSSVGCQVGQGRKPHDSLSSRTCAFAETTVSALATVALSWWEASYVLRVLNPWLLLPDMDNNIIMYIVYHIYIYTYNIYMSIVSHNANYETFVFC